MKKQLLKVSLILFSLFILIPSEKRGILVILFALITIITSPQRPKLKTLKLFVINALPFIVYLLSLVLYFDPEQTPKKLETGLSIIVLPLIFAITNKEIFNKKFEILMQKAFVFSAVLLSLIILSYFLYLGYFTGAKTYGYCLSKLTNKLPLLADHPIYISIALSVSILFSYNIYLNINKYYEKLILLIAVFIVFATILFLSRRGPVFALCLALIPVFYKLYKSSNRKSLLMKLGIGAIVSAITIILLVKPINKRVIEVLNPKTYAEKNETNSTNNRIQIYKCAVELIKEKPILGYGIGRDRKELYDCYKENLYYLYENKFNTHNQYLSIMLRFGFLGFVVFSFFLYYNFRIAIRLQSTTLLSILIFYTINFLFENVMERQNGIILFAFLINYYAFMISEGDSTS